jgi:uncharacterized protein (DUF983 family)
MTTVSLVRVFKTLGTGALLRCPRCGSGRLFDGFFHMRSDCPQCHLKFEREQGFFVGAIYINYAATVMIVIPGFFLLDYHAGLSLSHQLLLWGAFAIVFPILFFRHSRSLWLSVAYLFDPNDKADLRLVRK